MTDNWLTVNQAKPLLLADTPNAVDVRTNSFSHGTFLQAVNEFGACLRGVRIVRALYKGDCVQDWRRT